MEATVIDPSGARRPLDMPLSWSMQPGERVVLGRAIEGARAYLAVRGGWRTPIRLGSRSSEERLRAGDVLPAETGAIPTRRPSILLWEAPAAEPFRAVNGPDAVAAGASIWLGARFRVGSRSDRMGLRLEGDPVAVSAPAGRLSAPVAAGAVQLAGGQVIVLGAAAGTIGGYPHVAHVISADLDRLGQLRPGDVIRFRRVDIDEARREDRERQRARSALLGRIAALAQGP
jgi:allophanate hydrolase subunit 2